MNLKEQKTLGIHPNNSFRIHSLDEKEAVDYIHPINKHPHYFSVISFVDKPFIVDWQLSGE